MPEGPGASESSRGRSGDGCTGTFIHRIGDEGVSGLDGEVRRGLGTGSGVPRSFVFGDKGGGGRGDGSGGLGDG